MPALAIFKNFTTRPFGGDDLHLVCIILSFYRFIQFITLTPLCIYYYLQIVRGENIYVNNVPPWCEQYEPSSMFLLFVDDLGGYDSPNSTMIDEQIITSYRRNSFAIIFIVTAIIYFVADVMWICMVWSASSLGTPTVTEPRDKYLWKLIIFKLLVSNVCPFFLLIFGVHNVYQMRHDNYGCGVENQISENKPDEGVWYGLFVALLITYALELFIWPAILVQHIMRQLRSKSYLARSRVEADDRRAQRLEQYVGLALRLLQCITCNMTSDFKNKGELKEFAVHFMDLMNYNTRLDIVLSDMYVGMNMVARVQAEEKVKAIQKIALKNKFISHLIRKGSDEQYNPQLKEGMDDPFPDHVSPRGRHNPLLVLCANDESSFDINEREMLGSNPEDELLMKNAASYSRYAQVIYTRLKLLVEKEFTAVGQQEVTHFVRDLETLYHRVDEFRLTDIGIPSAILCYATFQNGLVSTPYAIMIDEEVENIVITIRGTLSLDDMVVDLQYNPVSMERCGDVCGFEGKGHVCHKGFLTRAKWLYNDIKRSNVLKTLYADDSPFKEYSLTICGHSLGAGCAILLSIMLRPTFPALKCYAYCPPGSTVDDEMAKYCEAFIISIVRQDDFIPRVSHHNIENLRDEFMNVIARMKVPKIEIFFDIQNPCPDVSVVARNRKVLNTEEDIEDTEFYRQLELFRAERAEQNLLSDSTSDNLFIAGKIVHLVDASTKGDNTKYVAYWADRHHDFNQVVISDRMKADHSMIDLVDVLRDIDLDSLTGNTISLAFHRTLRFEEEEAANEDSDIRLFMCCSNPDGYAPIVLSILTAAALVLSAKSMTFCSFFSRESTMSISMNIEDPNNTLVELETPFSAGIFSYTLLACEDGQCDHLADDTEVVIPSTFCVPYPNAENNSYTDAARTFAFLVIVLGGISFLVLQISTCFPIRRWAWKLVTCLFLFTAMCQGLVFLFAKSDMCKPHSDDSDSDDFFIFELDSQCHLSEGAIEAIVAGILYFFAAVGSAYFTREKKKDKI